MEQKRIYLFDNIKFLLILLVVIGHLIEHSPMLKTQDCFRGIFLYIYAFHMPLFIFISGLFYRHKDIIQKVFSFFAIYTLMKILLTAAETIAGQHISFSLFNATASPWYMLALAAFTVITYILKDIDKRFLLIISIVIACFVGYDNRIGDMFALSRIIVFYPFFLAGTMLDAEKIENITNKGIYKALSGTILIAWGLFCGFDYYNVYKLRPLFTARNSFERLNPAMADFGGLYRLLCYAVSALLCFAVICLFTKKEHKIMTAIGSKTLQIYFWHGFFIRLLVQAPFIQSLVKTPAGQWIYLACAFPLMLLISLKPFEFPCNLIMKYSKSKNKEKII